MAIHASRRAQLPTGSTVLVFGAGAVGLLVAAMAKISGASTVVIADIDGGRVDFAVKNGFAHRGYTVPMKRGGTVEESLSIAKETATEVGKLQTASGKPVGEVDAVFECTGVPSCLQAAIYVSFSNCSLWTQTELSKATRPGGKIMLIGMGTPVQTLPISAAALREVDLVGVFRYANTYPTGVEVVSKKGPDYPDFSKLVTHRYRGLEDVEKAFETAARTKDDDGNLVIKVVLEMDDEDKARL